MEHRLPVRTIGGCFALTAFAVAILAGLGADLPAHQILWRAILSLCFCYLAGTVIGSVAERAVRDHMSRFVQLRPMGQGSASSRSGVAGAGAQSSQGERG